MFGRKAAKKKHPHERVPLGERVAPSKQNRLFFYGLLGIILVLSALIFQPFTVAVLTGLLLAYLSYPVYKFFRVILRFRGIAAATALLFILGMIVVPLAFLGIALVDDAREFATGLTGTEPPEFLTTGLDIWLKTRVEDPNNVTQIQMEKDEIVRGLLRDASTFLIEALPATITLIGNLLINTFIVAFIMFYIFVDGENFVKYIRRTMPLPPHQTDFLFDETGNAVNAIFMGQLFSALLQGIVGGVGFWIFGVPNAFFWGAGMALLSLLPVIGAFLVWLPASVWLFIKGDATNALLLVLWGAVLVSNVDNVAKPLLIGERSDIHPILVLIGILGGIIVFGAIGFILGPLILGFLVAVLKVWNAEYHDWNGWRLLRGDRKTGAEPAETEGTADQQI